MRLPFPSKLAVTAALSAALVGAGPAASSAEPTRGFLVLEANGAPSISTSANVESIAMEDLIIDERRATLLGLTADIAPLEAALLLPAVQQIRDTGQAQAAGSVGARITGLRTVTFGTNAGVAGQPTTSLLGHLASRF